MTPRELYALPPIAVSHDITNVVLRSHIPEVDFNKIASKDEDAIEIRYYADYCQYGERVWILATIWYMNEPVMVCQMAGRGGRDNNESFVTDAKLYKEVVKKLISFYHESAQDVYADNANIPNLTSFYNDSLEKHYDKNLQPKYKVGDVLEVNVLENHLDFSDKKIAARVRVDRVNKYDPFETYYGYQLDRRWLEPADKYIPVIDVGHGTFGAQFNDNDVIRLLE